jgi:uncharacterized protein (TIGR00369 family)
LEIISLDADAETKSSTGPHQFELERWISCAPFERLLHMNIVEALDGRATLTMPFLLDFAQGGGLMHGGALVTLADTAVVMAIKSILDEGTHFATISMETKFLYPVKQGIVTARARVAHREGRSIEGRAILYNEEERSVLEFISHFKIARDKNIRGITIKNQG